ncbi:MAG: hypothetical protein V1929_08220, partial [bacterium]
MAADSTASPAVEAPQAAELLTIPTDKLQEIGFYRAQRAKILARAELPTDDTRYLKTLDAQRLLQIWSDEWESNTGIPFTEAARQTMTPLERLGSSKLLDQNEKELDELETAIEAVDKLDPAKKRRWLGMIARVRVLQSKARSSVMHFGVYVVRDSEKGGVLQMTSLQQGYFSVWNDERFPHSIVMAPPGHTKTCSFRIQILWDIAQAPQLRTLILYATVDTAKGEVNLLKAYFRSPRMRALYPWMRVLKRSEGARDSSERFTITRPNWSSREPTVEGSGITGEINGRGYDRIYIDDPCSPKLAIQAGQRDSVNKIFEEVVEQRLRDPVNARIRMICTPWHVNDLPGYIEKQSHDGDRTDWRIERFEVKDDAKGMPIPLWPERYPASYYRVKRRQNPANYQRQYKLKATV